jgi:hypothetical protein
VPRISTLLDLFGVCGLGTAAGFAVDWTAGVAVVSVAALVASWRASS